MALNLFFFTYPLSWNALGIDKSELWKVYLIVFSPSVLFVFPYIRWAEKRGRFYAPVLLGWACAAVGYAVYWLGARQPLLLYLSGAAFFLGYSMYQPLLPAFLSKRVPTSGRGSSAPRPMTTPPAWPPSLRRIPPPPRSST